MSTYYCYCQCGEFIYTGDRHRCPPVWLVYSEEYGEVDEDARRIYARDAQRAAEFATEKHLWSFDSGCGPFELLVRPEADDTAPWERWSVEVEMTPVFAARKMKPKEAVA